MPLIEVSRETFEHLVQYIDDDLTTPGSAVEALIYHADRCTQKYAELRGRVNSVFDTIVHGDKEHRAWLKTKLEEHFK